MSETETPLEFADQYVTEAIESGVQTPDGDLLGHVALLDLDGSSLGEARTVARRLGGVAAILRSSEQSYHVWGLSMHPLEKLLGLAERLEAVDHEHLALSSRRECFVLRLDAKVSCETGVEVKPAPRVIETVSTRSAYHHSEPHREALNSLEGETIEETENHTWAGSRADRRVYMADIGGE